MGTWKKCLLGDIITLKNGKKRVKQIGDTPVYGGNGILDYTSQSNNENCVIIGRVGAYCGNVFYEKNKCNCVCLYTYISYICVFMYVCGGQKITFRNWSFLLLCWV